MNFDPICVFKHQFLPTPGPSRPERGGKAMWLLSLKAARAPMSLLFALLGGCEPCFFTHFDVKVSAAGLPVEGVTLLAFPTDAAGSSRVLTDAAGQATFDAGRCLGYTSTVLVAYHPDYALWVGGAGAQFSFEPRFGWLGGPTDWDATAHVQLRPPQDGVGSRAVCDGGRCEWTLSSPRADQLFLVDPVAGVVTQIHVAAQPVGAGSVRFSFEAPQPGRYFLVAESHLVYPIDGGRGHSTGVHVVSVSDPLVVAG